MCVYEKKKKKFKKKTTTKCSSNFRLCVGEVDFECGNLNTVNVLLMHYSRYFLISLNVREYRK